MFCFWLKFLKKVHYNFALFLLLKRGKTRAAWNSLINKFKSSSDVCLMQLNYFVLIVVYLYYSCFRGNSLETYPDLSYSSCTSWCRSFFFFFYFQLLQDSWQYFHPNWFWINLSHIKQSFSFIHKDIGGFQIMCQIRLVTLHLRITCQKGR